MYPCHQGKGGFLHSLLRLGRTEGEAHQQRARRTEVFPAKKKKKKKKNNKTNFTAVGGLTMQMYSGPAGHFWLQPAPNEGFMGQGDLGLTEPGTGRALQRAPGMLGAAGGHLLESPLGPPAPGPCPSCRALLGPVQALCYVAGTGKSLPKPALTTWFLNRNSCAPRLLGHRVHHVNSCVYLCFSGSVAQLLGETPRPAPPGASRGPRADGDSSKVPARARTHAHTRVFCSLLSS